jgi:selenocysteine lyase/cysteine desulfurase
MVDAHRHAALSAPSLARTVRRALLVHEEIFDEGDAPLLELLGAEATIDLVDGRPVRAVHADNAATTLVARRVHDKLEAFWPWYGSAHRGSGLASQVTTELLGACRRSVAHFVGARPGDHVVFARNTTDALALLAHALPENTAIFGFDFEHHANLLPWRRAASYRALGVPRSHDELIARLEAALASCTECDRLVAITGASNVTGELVPLERVVAMARRYGARVLVDGAQLVPHRAIAIAALGVDYLVFSGHKLYAPLGAGVLVGRGDWLDAAAPYLAGGGAVQHVGDGAVTWHTGPARHEGGTPNVPGALALAAACEALEDVGFKRLVAHEERLRDALLAGLRRVEGLELLRIFPGETQGTATAAFRVRGFSPGLLAAALAAEHGISVRDGAFCAHPLVRALVGVDEGGSCGGVPGAVRVSFGAGSRLADVERLLCALDDLATRGLRTRYGAVAGRLAPVHDTRARPVFLRSERAFAAP